MQVVLTSNKILYECFHNTNVYLSVLANQCSCQLFQHVEDELRLILRQLPKFPDDYLVKELECLLNSVEHIAILSINQLQ